MIWQGAVVDIPASWVLCDGNNGTPDLRNRFLVGAGAAYNPDDTGGNVQHDHTFNAGTHLHGKSPLIPLDVDAPGSTKRLVASMVLGTTDNTTELPPYYSLAYIMKV